MFEEPSYNIGDEVCFKNESVDLVIASINFLDGAPIYDMECDDGLKMY